MRAISAIATALLFLVTSCQSAFRIPPESLPKVLVNYSSIKLIGEDKSTYNLHDIVGGHDVTVAIFWQIECPCVKRYQARVNRLFERYARAGVAFMHVSSNTNESFEDVKSEYHERAIPLPLMRDEGAQLAESLGVKGTPTAVIFNRAGEVVYMGWIDNERDENQPGRIAYLDNALREITNKRPITEKTSPMFGCSIR